MKKSVIFISFLVLSSGLAASQGFAASPVPCEDMLKDVRAAKSSATLSDADKATVAQLEAKGVERCNADDDKRADEFFQQALKIMGK
ncbi:hypothetical protein HB779_21820 (plasmid) [Phyllobacterium sp. 628]|uniref:hypothetical protein n=1 Tax=Phyllobacterium sp. 628 TaxID=2718938 RepID=UPI0016625058|nr:hypothetical protein [Phyllobacterium sp. 628]QND54548.1 hypothetical protein HB779_21820 [Phyllobacterium sp. 628]